MVFAVGLMAYLTATTFTLPTMTAAKIKLNEKHNRREWDLSDSVTVVLASLLWPAVIGHFLCALLFRKTK